MYFYANIFTRYFANRKLYSIWNRFSLVIFTLRIVSKFPTIIIVISHLLRIQKYTLRSMKSMLNSNLTLDINFTTFVPRKSVSIDGFWIVASTILIVFVFMLENDDVFKLSIYLNIYFFSCVDILPAQSVEASLLRILEVFILRCLLITRLNKTSKVLTLKLTADLIKAYQQHWHYRKCLIVSLRLFPTGKEFLKQFHWNPDYILGLE